MMKVTMNQKMRNQMPKSLIMMMAMMLSQSIERHKLPD